MNMMGIVYATLVVGAVGLLIGLLLGVTGHIFAVETDEREAAIRVALPGNNCGGCGYPGCDGLAAAIHNGEASVDQCPVGGAAVAAKIAEIMNIDINTVKKTQVMKAFVKCKGDNDTAVLNEKGRKECKFGCIACGICEKRCGFDAIHVINGLAVVDKEKCVACGACVTACPKKIIELFPESSRYVVLCSSHDKGKDVKAVCSVGCIGCGICVKQCPVEAITMEENLASIHQDICVKCGACAAKCPTKVISGREA